MDIRFLVDCLKAYNDDNHATETSVTQVNTITTNLSRLTTLPQSRQPPKLDSNSLCPDHNREITKRALRQTEGETQKRSR